jgi:DNA-binding SARP family transcriptional activator
VADGEGVRIRLLGGFEVTVGDRPVAADAWRLRKAKTLVKLLALAGGHRMHREALAAVLWPDRDGASAANNLHQALYVARRVVGRVSGGLFCLRDDVVLLSEGAMPWLDTEAFDAACQQARRTRDPQDYRTAAELYRGDLLPEDRFEDWAEGPREAFRERRLGLLMEYAELLSGQGEHTQVVDIMGAVTAACPFHEGAHRTLMTALAAGGRRYEALAAFDRLRETLAEEYAADPEPATRQLYRDLLTDADAPPDAPRAGGVAVATRDVTRMPSRPPGHAGDSLRPEQTSFIGRRRELTEIDQALGRTRLLTLTGPGGAGKTRLAYEAAARLVDSYPDGVHVAELASLSRPELVPQTVASVLDVPLPETGKAEVALARQLAGRRLLLVLDNCEHLLDACARLAAALLRACPDAVVLATSREPLRVGGEVTWRTPSLALPNLQDLPPSVAWPSWNRSGCSSSGRVTRRRASCSTRPRRPRWRRSASAWMGCRSPSSLPRRGRLPWRPRRSPRASTTPCASWVVAAAPPSPASRRCTPRWRGATTCSTRTSVSCSGAWRCSRAACRWRRWSTSVAATAWTPSTC